MDKYLIEFGEIADDWFKQESFLGEWYAYYQNFFTEENLKKTEWEDFQEMGNHIHSFNSMAIAKGNALGRINLPIEEYRRIFLYIISGNDPINVTINNLYKKYDGNAFLPFFSDSSISELIAYAFPERYVLYNRRDVKALEILGITMDPVRGEKFGDLFLRYNELLNPVLEKYKKIVGQRTNTTVQLELDQFFSWLYMTKKADQPIKKLITRYKRLIGSQGLSNEKYKWEFLRDFKGKPYLKGNIFQEIKSIKFGNLMYHLSTACIKGIAKDYGSELITEFSALRDESTDLVDRITTFNKNTLKLYRKQGGENSHHQDERCMSVYLTLFKPEEYTFYKNHYYQEYCKLIGEKKAKTKHKYAHYLELIKDLAENYIAQDQELLNLVHQELGDLTEQDPNYLLVAQDILYQLLNTTRDTNYWIFQGNPKVYDFETALENEMLSTWAVSAHKDKINIGDKIILWITGDQSGCYALAEVTSEVKERTPENEQDSNWIDNHKSEFMVDIKITHNLIGTPILKNKIQDIEALSDIKAGSQGTNFSSTETEYEAILEFIKNMNTKKYWLYSPGENAERWEEFFEEGLMAIGYDKLGDLNNHGDRNDIKIALKKEYGYKNNPMNHSLANFEFRDGIAIGDIIIAKRGRKEYIGYGVVTSEYYYDSQVDSYTSRRTVDWKKNGVWNIDGDTIVLKTLTDITKYPDYVNALIKLLGIEEGNNLQNTNTSDMAHSLNTIFYGPPGTGKTYKLSKELFPKYTDSTESKSREELLDELVSSYTWFEAIAAAIFEKSNVSVSDILVHELVIAKGNSSESKSKRATIWGQLQAHTDFDCDVVKRDLGGRREPLVMWKDENKTWRFHDEFEEDSIASSIELLERSKNLHSNKNEVIKRYEFTTFHQSFSYEDFIEGIKPIMNGENEGEVQYEIQDGIFKKISTKARNNPEQQYALFIDEINRGNVANIFGELITLIEPDKREGEENELSVVLPYSKKSFSVPKNLDIIGTMNTADRSVEALDTALRRRFSFIEMKPNSKVLKDENIKCGKVDIPKLLDTINLRIEKLLDKDHCIGHSYFFKLRKDSSLSMLQGIFKDNIIPLLQEYFYGDFGKIGLVLGKAFVTESNTSKDVFHTDFSYEDRDLLLERKVYEFTDVSKLSQEDFISIYG